jgi:hypothetical protein
MGTDADFSHEASEENELACRSPLPALTLHALTLPAPCSPLPARTLPACTLPACTLPAPRSTLRSVNAWLRRQVRNM